MIHPSWSFRKFDQEMYWKVYLKVKKQTVSAISLVWLHLVISTCLERKHGCKSTGCCCARFIFEATICGAVELVCISQLRTIRNKPVKLPLSVQRFHYLIWVHVCKNGDAFTYPVIKIRRSKTIGITKIISTSADTRASEGDSIFYDCSFYPYLITLKFFLNIKKPELSNYNPAENSLI